jgi:hypothetical protein
MLPSFRLIVATFLCGFVVVFAGLRMAVSLNDIHEGLPVMAGHAAPVSVTPAADSEARRGLAAVPVMYDLRFAVGMVSPAVVRVVPTVFDRPAPPLAIIPPQDLIEQNLVEQSLIEQSLIEQSLIEQSLVEQGLVEQGLAEQGLVEQSLTKQDLAEPAKETPEPERTVAAIQPDAPVTTASDAPILDAPPEAPKLETPTVAAVATQATPDLEASAAEPLIPEPDTTASIATPDQGIDPAPTAVPTPIAKPKAAKPAPKAVAKVARKKRVRTAQRAAPANNPLGINPASNPFAIPQQ